MYLGFDGGTKRSKQPQGDFFARIALLYQIASFRPVNKYGRQGQFLFLIGYC
jgi:hypothetical protein